MPAAWSTSIAADHFRRGGCLIEEDWAIQIEVGLALKTAHVCRSQIRPLLLDRVDSPFSRVIPCRVKKTDRLLVRAWATRPWSMLPSFRRKESGCSSSVRRMTQPALLNTAICGRS